MIALDEAQWQPLAAALRDEAQEYAWLLSLLEQQQKGILEQNYAEFPELTHSIEEQLRTTAEKRGSRESLAQQLRRQLGMDERAPLREIVQLVQGPAHGMFDELLKELRSLTERLQNRSRQNKLLLARANELSRELLSYLQPTQSQTTYNQRGYLAFKTNSRSTSLSLQA
ncbi:MAG: flagellar export chaperone FlgN [Verrucomicrobiota bacterium JB022]|nr:flagellar export chaperone FlgN [Verrucomicrobiota bacterium JB022]